MGAVLAVLNSLQTTDTDLEYSSNAGCSIHTGHTCDTLIVGFRAAALMLDADAQTHFSALQFRPNSDVISYLLAAS